MDLFMFGTTHNHISLGCLFKKYIGQEILDKWLFLKQLSIENLQRWTLIIWLSVQNSPKQ